jgi:hypothetical protein
MIIKIKIKNLSGTIAKQTCEEQQWQNKPTKKPPHENHFLPIQSLQFHHLLIEFDKSINGFSD